MSRNKTKITKALETKGYLPLRLEWTPVGHAPIMCGPEDGWLVIAISKKDHEENGQAEELGEWPMGYNTDEILDEIERLPNAN